MSEGKKEASKHEADYEDFNPMDYLRVCYSDLQGSPDEPGLLPFLLKTFHDIFKDGTIHGDQLLDVGTGPSVISVISASKWFKGITLSEFTSANRAALQSWVNTGNESHDFSIFFKYFCQLEGNLNEWENRQAKLRSSIQNIVSCDVTKENILGAVPNTKYDAITSCLCLEAAVNDSEAYTNAIKNMAAVLKPGGHLVLVGLFGNSFYMVGNKKFEAMPFDKAFIENVLINNFEIVRWVTKEDKLINESITWTGLYGVVAKKR